MALNVKLFLAVAVLGVGWWLARVALGRLRYERTRRLLGCPPLERYPARDRVLGLDYVWALMRALKEDRVLAFQEETYSARVWTANFLGSRMVYSVEPEHMKAVSTTHRDCFAIEPIRVGNGAITPFTGRGVSSSDGAEWAAARKLVKPYFERAGFANLDRLSGHVDRLIGKIPTDGSTVDMQPLLQRWVSSYLFDRAWRLG